MVLRKHIPPRLSNSSRGNDCLDSSSPSATPPADATTTITNTTNAANTATAANTNTTSTSTTTTPSPSPRRLTRRRAPSSPQPRRNPPSPRVPSDQSIFSPDLNTSPAFDLMPLEQAQKSPSGATSAEPPNNPWSDEWSETPYQGEEVHDQKHHVFDSKDQHVSGVTDTGSAPPPLEEENAAGGKTPTGLPSVLVAGTQRRMTANEWKPTQSTDDDPGWEQEGTLSDIQLQSNNPFLKSNQLEENAWGNGQAFRGGGGDVRLRDSHATELSDALSQSEGYIPMTARLSLLDQPPSEFLWAEERPISAAPASSYNGDPQVSQNYTPQVPSNVAADEVPMGIYVGHGPSSGDPPTDPSTNPPPVSAPPTPHTTFTPESCDYAQQQPQQSIDNGASLGSKTGIVTPAVTVSSAARDSHQDLIEFDDPVTAEGNSLYRPSSSVYESDAVDSLEPISPAQPSSSATPPPLPSRGNSPSSSEHSLRISPNAPLTEAESKRQQEQRAETYSIRHVNWTDGTGKLRNSPILIQNKNGPCPLLALVNSLVMSADRDEPLPIVKALQTREHISLGLLIEALFDELTTCLGPDSELPDIEALSRFLTMLHTGMNVNPRLTLEPGDLVGSFLQTSDIRLYGTFGVPLIHGWVAPPSSETHAALARVAQYHEDIQLLQFRKDELENRVLRGAELIPEEEQLFKDIYTIQHFVEVENATQLSLFGLQRLREKVLPGTVSILFRNDHFSTLYKHPDSHRLFTLVTDAGYANHAEIVWESLVDVNGFNAELFSGDFRPVGNIPSGSAGPAGPRTSSNSDNATTRDTVASEEPVNTALSPQEQEQADADYAYALSLQFQEEEWRQRETSRNNQQTRNRSASTPYRPDQTRTPARNAPNRFSTSGSGQAQQQREQQRQFGKGPDDEPPPPYEQATGIHRHVGSHANPYSTNSQSPSPRRPPVSGPAAYPPLSDRSKDKNKDCVVM